MSDIVTHARTVLRMAAIVADGAGEGSVIIAFDDLVSSLEEAGAAETFDEAEIARLLTLRGANASAETMLHIARFEPRVASAVLALGLAQRAFAMPDSELAALTGRGRQEAYAAMVALRTVIATSAEVLSGMAIDDPDDGPGFS